MTGKIAQRPRACQPVAPSTTGACFAPSYRQRLTHFKQDRDFAGTRAHPAFVNFLVELKKPAGGR
jgi:hypothetical protein